MLSVKWKTWVAWLCRAAFFLLIAVPPAAAATRDHRTTRIVSLVPNLTELAFAIGAGDQVVGVSDFCFYPPAARTRPRVGGLVNPNLEAILRLNPSHVLLYRSQADLAGRLKRMGIRAHTATVDTLADLSQAFTDLGRITGQTTATAAVGADLQRRLDQVRAGAAPLKARGIRGLVIVSRDPQGLRNLYQADGTRFLGELFQLAGGQLAVPAGAPVTVEQIIRSNPDIIIDMSYASAAPPDGEPTDPEKHLGPWAALNTVTAVKTGQVYRWSDPHRLLLGTTVADTAAKMQDVLRSIVGQ